MFMNKIQYNPLKYIFTFTVILKIFFHCIKLCVVTNDVLNKFISGMELSNVDKIMN